MVAGMKWLLAVAAAALLTACGTSSAGTAETPGSAPSLSPVATSAPAIPAEVSCQWARVRSVTDGDTIRVDFENGPANQPVRYIGIDAPETVAPGTPVQPFGPEASRENARLVAGKSLCLEEDISERDRYGRLLRYAWLPDGAMVNEALVLAGLATVDTFPPDVKYADRFTTAQHIAREAQRGLWAP